MMAILGTMFVLAVAWALSAGRPASAESATAKTAADSYKNIQVLKQMPADQLRPTMQFIAASLGVGCDHCHMPGAFEKDDKKPKQIARKMMQMMFAINQNNFDGHREVTCYSCHRGAAKPVSVPIIVAEQAPPTPPPTAEGTAPPLPSADQILDKYAQAIGGADAVGKISSRVESGTVSAAGRQYPIEISIKAPGKQSSVLRFPEGENMTVLDGPSAWQAGLGHPAREIAGSELDALKLDADLRFPVDAKQIFSDLKVGEPEKIGDHETYLVSGIREGMPPVKLYFDQKSGLLLRQVRYAETPLGWVPTQIDYADYRDTQGVKLPYRWTTAQPGRGFTTQLEQVQQNVPVDNKLFAKPETPKAPQP
jgi:photosynthetic reaction center cytochrome c subunit